MFLKFPQLGNNNKKEREIANKPLKICKMPQKFLKIP